MTEASDENEDLVMVNTIDKDDDGSNGSNNSVIIHEDEKKEDENESDNDQQERLLSDILNQKLLEGYCLVFEREHEYFQMEVVDLRMNGDEELDLRHMDHMCNQTNVHGIK
eukprot:853966_1